MDALVTILGFLEPHAIYDQIANVARFYLKWLVPIFFVLCLASRYLEDQLANLGGQSSMAEAVRDAIKAILWTAAYAGIGALVFQLEIHLSALFYEKGSFTTIMQHYKKLLQAAMLVAENGDWISSGVNLLNFGSKSLAWILFMLSFVLLVLVLSLLRIAYALGFGLLYVWGLAAVPTMASRLLNLSSAWFRAVLTVLLWPLIEATILMFIIPLFAGWGDSLNLGGGNAAGLAMKQTGLYLLFMFCNLIMAAVAMGSAYIAITVASNQNMMSGLVTPFVLVAGAGFQMFQSATQKVAHTATSPIADLAGNAATAANQHAPSFAFKHIASTAKAAVEKVKTMTPSRLGQKAVDAHPTPNSKGPGA